jgi:hypothetical protein
MRFYHTTCKGEIDVKKRQCTKCKKKWNPIAFRFDPTGIRPIVDRKGRPLPDRVLKVERKTWGIPYLNTVVSKLPKWPRWARVLVTLGVLVVIVLIIYYIWR